ncbi:hypothetical protein N3K66_009082 [Trichothecium roseum]|uniref:Uncharacterized protein n=1 Tax=Trichothecium roseum TaxID=47278 RepID=A0ACC0UPH7_9HYPO|nr:hypothetical protein N3K66_009082 [Trichothecium roseum]
MTQPSSTGTNKVSKRKGTRSVSTLTPAQLARKRANDREAQRAIRSRTKEHIERLESELDELRSQKDGNETVRELLRKNKLLEEELCRLKESMSSSITFSSHSTPSYDDTLNNSIGVIPSTLSLPFLSGGFSAGFLPDYALNYMPISTPNSILPSPSIVGLSVPDIDFEDNTGNFHGYGGNKRSNEMLPMERMPATMEHIH